MPDEKFDFDAKAVALEFLRQKETKYAAGSPEGSQDGSPKGSPCASQDVDRGSPSGTQNVNS